MSCARRGALVYVIVSVLKLELRPLPPHAKGGEEHRTT